MTLHKIAGTRTVISAADYEGTALGEKLAALQNPPDMLYVIGDPSVLEGRGIAVIGARRATPYGLAAAKMVAGCAAQHGACVFSGGARGVDAAGHWAALEEGGRTVAVLGGGLDRAYPVDNIDLFQTIVDRGGALVSEQPWDVAPAPYMFRARNRITAALSEAVAVCESGLPSGTFSTCDEALSIGKDVWAVPGGIFSAASRGCNELISEGAVPITGEGCLSQLLEQHGFTD